MKYGEVRRGTIGCIGVEKLTPQLAEEVGRHEHATARSCQRCGADSEAYDAGLRPGDVIVGFNGIAIDDPSQFSRLVADANIGSTATVKVLRNGRTMEFKLPIVSSSRARSR